MFIFHTGVNKATGLSHKLSGSVVWSHFIFLSSQIPVVLVDAYFCLLRLYHVYTPPKKKQEAIALFSNVLQVDFLSEQSEYSILCFKFNKSVTLQCS